MQGLFYPIRPIQLIIPDAFFAAGGDVESELAKFGNAGIDGADISKTDDAICAQFASWVIL